MENAFYIGGKPIGLSKTTGPIASYTGEICKSGFKRFTVYPDYVIETSYQSGSMGERSDLILLDIKNKKYTMFDGNWCMDYWKFKRATNVEKWIEKIKGPRYWLEIEMLEREGFKYVGLSYFEEDRMKNKKLTKKEKEDIRFKLLDLFDSPSVTVDIRKKLDEYVAVVKVSSTNNLAFTDAVQNVFKKIHDNEFFVESIKGFKAEKLPLTESDFFQIRIYIPVESINKGGQK